ncbi:MAG: 4-hydroxy-4-methyl-2-oxoglutarate aldolase [Nitratireductor sp.]|jgi:regulator of RNase E activity RraA|uniref:Putative 4-hydroxy-4-methyl-2-oxoglutarate aldolase n=2 Tax=Nitratireductor aquibiodomus TaxID=204799 RepID=A0A1H4QGZ9_9HYPH|nr:RraA family protein [Nitratireductor aquibiodomus]EIM77419.1 dimethylmenaquinone methyltransferase [Nitratireductor aquibiodomus RA22]MAS13155.1 4-hydroxy-4-methyl-2-oxoglutarate aldolase [Nitratireductor sp.]SEC18935.1 Regulator of RNase E activity RraA [Nitratireductor aquibiodomus]
MYQVNSMPEQLAQAKIDKLMQVETATVGHFLHANFLDTGIRSMLPRVRAAGTAVTLRLPHADSTLLHYAMDHIRPGDFVIIDRAGDTRHACWGGVITHTAARKKAAGAVVDGPATDVADFERHGFPMWCRGPSPITTKLLGVSGEMNIPVSVGGVVVNPGDAVLADENGVLILSPDEVDMVADRAIQMQAREVELLKRIDAGESLPTISGAKARVEASA